AERQRLLRGLRAPLRRRRLEHRGERDALALRQRSHLLVLGDAEGEQQAAATLPPPALLAHEKLRELHALGLPRALEDDLGDTLVARCHAALQVCTREPNAICVLER